MWDLVKITIELSEVISAVICFVLVWFMMKPYRLTGENSFLGLPLGFGIMGVSHVIATAVNFTTGVSWFWFMVLFRTFSFLFLATTYFFASRTTKKNQQLFNITLSGVIVTLFTFTLLGLIAPQLWNTFGTSQIYWRIFMVICLSYITAVTLRTHFKKPDPMTLWIPFGFIFLTLSQVLITVYSQVYKIMENSINVYWVSLAFRFAGLVMFLIVAYRTYYSSKED
jgi:hypothetical protein